MLIGVIFVGMGGGFGRRAYGGKFLINNPFAGIPGSN
jgi:hypothetical protein